MDDVRRIRARRQILEIRTQHQVRPRRTLFGRSLPLPLHDFARGFADACHTCPGCSDGEPCGILPGYGHNAAANPHSQHQNYNSRLHADWAVTLPLCLTLAVKSNSDGRSKASELDGLNQRMDEQIGHAAQYHNRDGYQS